MTVRALRGAIQIVGEDRDEYFAQVQELLAQMIAQNQVTQEDLISILFTATPDLKIDFPAAAARKMGLTEVPLMCAVEMDIAGALPRTIRVLAHANLDRSRSEIKHIYLGGAVVLRPDLAK
ncbi:chorismate mutase [Actinomycetes bacterium]|nr:chorismate mutase [Actinomycetes bacterium]